MRKVFLILLLLVGVYQSPCLAVDATPAPTPPVAPTVENTAPIKANLADLQENFEEIRSKGLENLIQLRKDHTAVFTLLSKKEKLTVQELTLNYKKSNELSKIWKQLEVLERKLDKYDPSFMILSLISGKMPDYLKSDRNFLIAIEFAIRNLSDKDCLTKGACSWLTWNNCEFFGYDEEGIFSASTEDFETIEKDRDWPENPWWKHAQLACAYQGATAGVYEPKMVKVEYKPIPPDFSKIYNDLDTFKSSCIDTSEMESFNTKIDDFKTRFAGTYVDSYKFNLEGIRRACTSAVNYKCSKIYIIKGQGIESYCTASGEIREVTIDDVKRDAEMMETTAMKLNHMGLADNIDYCQAAAGAGFTWDFKPISATACRKAVADANKTEPGTKAKKRKKKS